MVRRNYQFEKRQKDLARKKKKEEKLKRKQEKRDILSPGDPGAEGQDENAEADIDSADNGDATSDSEESGDTEETKSTSEAT